MTKGLELFKIENLIFGAETNLGSFTGRDG
jgi:hypothetical protein